MLIIVVVSAIDKGAFGELGLPALSQFFKHNLNFTWPVLNFARIGEDIHIRQEGSLVSMCSQVQMFTNLIFSQIVRGRENRMERWMWECVRCSREEVGLAGGLVTHTGSPSVRASWRYCYTLTVDPQESWVKEEATEIFAHKMPTEWLRS